MAVVDSKFRWMLQYMRVVTVEVVVVSVVGMVQVPVLAVEELAAPHLMTDAEEVEGRLTFMIMGRASP